MKKALTPRQWLDVVRAYLADDAGKGAGLMRVDPDDERVYYDSLADAEDDMTRKRAPGRYKLIAADGEAIAECIIGSDGLRTRRGDSSGVRETSLARERAQVSSQWEQLSASQQAFSSDLIRQLDKKDRQIEELRKECDALKDQLREAAIEASDTDSTDDLIELAKQGIELFRDNTSKKAFHAKAVALFQQLSPEAQAEVGPILNQLFAAPDIAGVLSS